MGGGGGVTQEGGIKGITGKPLRGGCGGGGWAALESPDFVTDAMTFLHRDASLEF